MELKHYLEQHDRIREELAELKKLLAKQDLEQNATELAFHVSGLAGKLNIHLTSEDQYLYPSFFRGSDENLVRKAHEYQNEMGNLLAVFTDFKNSFNTKIKILSDRDRFLDESKGIIQSIQQRMEKEEKDLYRLV